MLDAFITVGAAALFIAGLFFIDSFYADQCHALDGEWHTFHGCKATNIHGQRQWVMRP